MSVTLETNSSLQVNLSVADDRWRQQLGVIATRWPELARQLAHAPLSHHLWREDTPQPTLVIDGLHLASGYDAAAEAELQAAQIPCDQADCTVYGLGSGTVPRILLQRPAIRSIQIVLFNPSVARTCLSYYPMDDWLTDPRVELSLATGTSRVARPFAAVPPCLQLADEASAVLRDRVWLDLSTPFIRQKQADDAAHWQQRFEDNLDLINQDGDAACVKGICPDTQVLVAGAGPSLTDYAAVLQQRGGSPLIAASSALRPLAQAGVVPDLVVVIDGAKDLVLQHFDGLDLSVYKDVPLIYFPRVHRHVLQSWPGPRLTAFPSGVSFKEGTPTKQRLFCSGSVLHPAIDLAVLMGAREVVLFGADFGFPGGQSHASEAAHLHQVADRFAGHWVINVAGERIPTSASMRGYLRDLEAYISRHGEVRFVTVTTHGAQILGAENCQQIGAES